DHPRQPLGPGGGGAERSHPARGDGRGDRLVPPQRTPPESPVRGHGHETGRGRRGRLGARALRRHGGGRGFGSHAEERPHDASRRRGGVLSRGALTDGGGPAASGAERPARASTPFAGGETGRRDVTELLSRSASGGGSLDACSGRPAACAL